MIAVMIAGATAMLIALFGTRYLIGFFRKAGAGQPILGKEDLGPEHHMPKQGTPTMGGIAIVVAAMIGWLVAHLRPGTRVSYVMTDGAALPAPSSCRRRLRRPRT